ncbi:cell division septation protein DedD [Archangium gephyra]|uniref:Cell division septation protein DedD n=1 Tax=Archangium gephyra TaxID=48 RepID=A0AAC8TEW8_9BACT|nr:SPOR domain-containing protein [Archangium gephyra]AKJ03372.1 Translation initiation factor 2 [Archangium gephyra]REG24119.1 cell division septation protein DedD [Archangium gephyra]
MRDAHRMKEKFDVSLDNRQIVSLLIAGIIVMGAVFVLGVVVGKKLAGNAQTAAAPDLLSALDANAQALQQARETEQPLTFQDELTRKSGSDASKPGTVTVAIPPPAPKPKPAEPKPEPTAADTQVAEAPAGEPTASPTDDDYAPPATAKATEPKPEPKPVETKVAESKPAPVPGKVEAAPVPTRTTTPAQGSGLKDAIARATQRPTEAAPGGAFTLQISAFQNRPEAERFAAKLRDRGYAPYIVTAEVPNKGTWYRVRMGSFPSKDAASRYLSDFKRETQLQAFVAAN